MINTPFKSYYLPAKQLFLHPIDYQTLQENVVATGLFQQLSLAASAKDQQILNIWEDQWHIKTAMVKARILHRINDGLRLGARSCTVQKIDKTEADKFFNANHLQGATTYHYKYGLFNAGKLVAAAAFGKSRVMVDGPNLYRSYELIRFASILDYTIVGGLGKLLNEFIRQHHVKHIMTYIDLDWGLGKSYRQLGFAEAGVTGPHLFSINPKTHERTYATKDVLTTDQTKEINGFNAGSIKLILDLRKL